MHVTNVVNGVDLDRLGATMQAIAAEPVLARFQFRAHNTWIDGGHNRSAIQGFHGAGQEDQARTEPFFLDADEPPVLLGRDQAPNAAEHLLHALAACLTGTMVYHAAAHGITIDSLEGRLEGDLDLQGFLGLDADTRPGYEGIRVAFRVSGDFDDAQLQTLARLTRYSPVRDSLTHPVPVAIDVHRA